MKASELVRVQPSVKLLIYGEPGSGKTTWAVRSPRPLVILTEPQAIPAIAWANPEADVEVVHDWGGFNALLDAITTSAKPIQLDNGQPALSFRLGAEEKVFQTLVVDSLSDLQEMAKAFVLALPRKEARILESDMEMRDWGRLGSVMLDMLKALRAIPCNQVQLCLMEASLDEAKVRHAAPLIQGALGARIGQWYTGVGVAHKQRGAAEVAYSIAWQTPSTAVSKPPPGWPVRIANTMQPGKTTLGSLLMAAHPGAVVPSAPGDDPSYAVGMVPVAGLNPEPVPEESAEGEQVRRRRA